MSELGTQISTPDDFANLAVFERDGSAGKIYTISFKQREFAVPKLMMWINVILLLFAILGMFVIPNVVERSGVHGINPALPAFGFFAAVIVFVYFQRRMRVNRSVEIESGKNQLRVLRKGRVEIVRKLASLDSLTVDVHPDAEFKRQNRLESGKKGLSDEEKQHCLFGWFGAGGAEQVILLTRAEWPVRLSLMEVQQAMIWVMKRINQSHGVAADIPDRLEPGTDTIKPPLD